MRDKNGLQQTSHTRLGWITGIISCVLVGLVLILGTFTLIHISVGLQAGTPTGQIATQENQARPFLPFVWIATLGAILCAHVSRSETSTSGKRRAVRMGILSLWLAYLCLVLAVASLCGWLSMLLMTYRV